MKKIMMYMSIGLSLVMTTSIMGYSQVSTGPKNNTRAAGTEKTTTTRNTQTIDRNDRDNKNNKAITPTRQTPTTPNSQRDNKNTTRGEAPNNFNRNNLGTIKRNDINYSRDENKRLLRNDLPTGYERMAARNNKNYYYHDGRYYMDYNGHYMETQPYIGMRVNRIPVGHTRFVLNRNTYYYYNGVYYTLNRGFYEVALPPIGTTVNHLPVGTERLYFYGNMYYEYYGIIYAQYGRKYQVVGYLDY